MMSHQIKKYQSRGKIILKNGQIEITKFKSAISRN